MCSVTHVPFQGNSQIDLTIKDLIRRKEEDEHGLPIAILEIYWAAF